MSPESSEPAGEIDGGSTEMPCPRCAYDQRGAFASCGGEASASATCSECGLVFTWADVTQPERINLRGFVEHSTGWDPTWLAALSTTLWTIWPPVFYARVRMEHRIVPRRWGAWVCWMLVPPIVLVFAVLAVWAAVLLIIRGHQGSNVDITDWYRACWWIIESIANAQLAYRSRLTFAAVLPVIWAVSAVAMSVIAFVASDSLGRMRVRRALIWRASAYSLAPALICVLLQLANSTAGPIGSLSKLATLGKATWLEVLVGRAVLNSPAMTWIGLALVLLGVVWCCAWWAVTMRRGWRIDSLWAVTKICIAQFIVAILSIMLFSTVLPL